MRLIVVAAMIAFVSIQAASGQAPFSLVGDTDDLFYAAGRKRLYISGTEGYIDVFQQQDADPYTRIAHVPTATGRPNVVVRPSAEPLVSCDPPPRHTER
jgi:hypothetical protein